MPQSKSRLETAFLGSFFALQFAHLAVVVLIQHPKIASNAVQMLMAFLTTLLCVYKARRCSERHQRTLWTLIAFSFFIWLVAEIFFLRGLLLHVPHESVPISDALWLFAALPLLLAASSTQQYAGRDAVGWLDTAQSCVFFLIVFALVYHHANIINIATAYNVQNMALLLAFSIRYSSVRSGPERNFFGNLAIYSSAYVICSSIGYYGWARNLGGPLIDLCWTLPFTAFGALMLCRDHPNTEPRRWTRRVLAPTHLHGVSASGLAIMSVVGSAVLVRHYPATGGLALAVSFLLFAVRTSIREWQLGAAHSELEYSALHDPLTGLCNRRMLEQELNAQLAQVGPFSAKRAGLLFIDLDRFKTINDALGHSFGDLLLSRVAELLRAAARPEDIVARQGGDEFVILLREVEASEAEAIAQRVIDVLRAPLLLEDRLVQVTASIGIVLSLPGSDADGLLQDADCAMYKAKGMGKDRAETFAPNMLTTAKRKLELETCLRQTLAENAIEVHYQPVFGLPELSVRGFEALARWRHPVHGIIAPAEFIPVAEDTGLIIELGRQVLEKACHACRKWNLRFNTGLRIAVNVSGHQLSDPGFLMDTIQILEAAQLSPSLLKLEITESVLIGNYNAVEEVLSKARTLGIGVCLDDFGTGFSSLSYLVSFPFDVVKIDRSFVTRFDEDPRRSALVRMIIELATTLNKKIIAEGVETEAELELLRELGCNMVQGYLLSQPLLQEAVESMLANAAILADPACPPVDGASPWAWQAGGHVPRPVLPHGVTLSRAVLAEIASPRSL
jgi:diguanylate cyclase (GGDEF)-like protein